MRGRGLGTGCLGGLSFRGLSRNHSGGLGLGWGGLGGLSRNSFGGLSRNSFGGMSRNSFGRLGWSGFGVKCRGLGHGKKIGELGCGRLSGDSHLGGQECRGLG